MASLLSGTPKIDGPEKSEAEKRAEALAQRDMIRRRQGRQSTIGGGSYESNVQGKQLTGQ